VVGWPRVIVNTLAAKVVIVAGRRKSTASVLVLVRPVAPVATSW
jgi:hypothetical protein